MIFDPMYFLFAVPGLILALWAAWRVKSTYAKYSEVATRGGVTGGWAARALLDAHGLRDVPVEEIPGDLTDHYDPGARVLRLSSGVFRSDSVAAVGVAAHETGHALQHAARYWPLALRTGVVPIAKWGPGMAVFMFAIGMYLGQSGGMLKTIAVVLFSAFVFFSLITLPVEIDASNRAMKLLGNAGVLQADELPAARKVLNAAAFTYVAAAIQAILTLLYMLSRRR